MWEEAAGRETVESRGIREKATVETLPGEVCIIVYLWSFSLSPPGEGAHFYEGGAPLHIHLLELPQQSTTAWVA